MMSLPTSDATVPSMTPVPNSFLFTIPEETEMRAEDVNSKDVQVQLQYLAEDPLYTNPRPLQCIPNPLDKSSKSNVRLVPGEPETVHDLRATHEEFNLDRNGFRYIKAPTNFKDWASEDDIGENYLLEVQELLRRELEGCDEILVVVFHLRRTSSESASNSDLQHSAIARQVHVNRTEQSVVSLVRKKYGLRADHLLAGRVRLISVWRPIRHAIYDCPIAVMDGSKLDNEKNVIEIDVQNPDTEELYDTMGGAHYRKEYHWYYMSEQGEEDVLLFKTYDSDRSVPATTCLHTIFDLPPSHVPPDAPPGESIEVQALVFTYPNRETASSSPEPHKLKGKAQNQQLQETTQLRTQLSTLQEEVKHSKDFIQAVLDLRQWESQKAAESVDHLLSDREHSRAEAIALDAQLNLLEERVMSLYIESSTPPQEGLLVEKLKYLIFTFPRLHSRLPEHRDVCESLKQAKKLLGPDAELLLLREQLEGQRAENRDLKAEVEVRAERKKDEKFRAEVAEAVRQERVKDEFVVQSLRRENLELRKLFGDKTAMKW